QLAESCEGPRGLADELRSDVAHHGALRSGEAQGGSKSEKDQRDDELAVRKVRFSDQAQAGQRGSLDEETRDDERPLAKAANSRTGDRRDEEHRRPPGHETKPGPQRSVALGRLQELSKEEDRRKDRTPEEEHRCVT